MWASNHVDGALLSTGEKLHMSGDTTWCFNHLMALVMKGAFVPEKLSASTTQAARDIRLLHDVSVYFCLHKQSHARLRWIQELDGEIPLAVLSDHTIRWDCIARLCSRLLEISKCITTFAAENLDFQKEMQKSEGCPKDFFQTTFWNRIEEYVNLLKPIQIICTRAQSQSQYVVSLIPMWIFQIKNLLKLDLFDSKELREVGTPC
jgi:hypothetical protein